MSEQDRINRLRKKLYSRNQKNSDVERHRLRSRGSSVQKAWQQNAPVERMPRPKKKTSFLKVFFTFSIIFFVGSVAFGAFYFFGERNVVSTENVDIQIQGPTAVDGGEELELQISIVNKNTTTLELADLLIEYPEGTRSPQNVQRELLRYRESLGNIRPGERVKKTVQAVLFGEENTQKDINVIVEYRVAGSNAIFFSEKAYPVTLSSSPVSVSVRSFSEITSGQEIDFAITVNSNSASAVEDVVLKAEYPFGFSFSNASPDPAFSNTIWELGDIEPGEEKDIQVSGVMTGQDEEERIFRFSVGVRDELDVKKLATTFVTSSRSVTIKRPFISVGLALDDVEKDSYVFQGRERVEGEISWKNNLEDVISNAQIEVTFSGNGLDESTVSANRGFYNSVTNTLRWSKETFNTFAQVDPSDAGILTFNFRPVDITSEGVRNPEILLTITVRGERMNQSNVPESIESSILRTVRFASDITLTPQLQHSSGLIPNSGPLPPRAEEVTSYTISWVVTNNANRVSGVEVTGVLPSYVSWTGNIRPQNANIQFNPNTNTVTWNVGEVEQGVGASRSPKEVAFQVNILPSTSQIGQSPVLVHTQRISGFDQFTEEEIEYSAPQVTIGSLSDTSRPSGFNRVTQ